MTVNFPSSPSQGDTYTYEAITYTFDGEKWVGSTASSFNDVTVSGASANVILQGNDSITTDQTFTFNDQGGKLVPYQQGAWTPVLEFGGGSTGMTYSSQDGWWVRTGNLVTVWATVVLGDVGTSTGNATFGGLPYTSAPAQSGTSLTGGGYFFFVNGLSSRTEYPSVAFNNSTMVLNMYMSGNSSATHSNFNTGTSMRFMATYLVNDTTWTPVNGATVS